MIHRHTLFAALLVTCIPAGVQARQDIESFDDLSGGNSFFAGTWEASTAFTGATTPAAGIVQGAGVLDIMGAGVTNDADSFLELHFAAGLDLSANNAVALDGAMLAGNEATSLEIRLFDLAGKSAHATALTSQLPCTVPWVAGPGFDATAVEIVRLSGGQLDGTALVAVRLDSIAAVFEQILVVYHDADIDRDNRLSLSELLRVIELYNTRLSSTRTGRYKVQEDSVDGFASDPDTANGASSSGSRFHTADTDQNVQFSLGELLRVIELYNNRAGSSRTGEYHTDPISTDGFSPGPSAGG
jgi:hypothetical protein